MTIESACLAWPDAIESEALLDELMKLRADAARYRWLKEHAEDAVENFWSDCTRIVRIDDEEIDAKIAEGK